MDTSLNTDTLHGVQPTLIGRYMVDTNQAPLKNNCSSDGFFLQQPGFHCDVRHKRNGITDEESKLFGLDRRITKQEPAHNTPAVTEPKEYTQPSIKESYNAPFESVNTRVGRSCNILSGVNVNRFEDPMHNPQIFNQISMEEPFRGGFQTRMAAKDCQVSECGQQLRLKPGYGTRCFK